MIAANGARFCMTKPVETGSCANASGAIANVTNSAPSGTIDATRASRFAARGDARYQLQGETPEIHQLGKTLKEVESAARALREFLDTLEKKPESLIRGKSEAGQ